MINVQEYIESGVLNDYCLGLLSSSKQLQVEADCAQYPALKEELDAIRASLEKYKMSEALPGPTGMRERIWQSLAGIGIDGSVSTAELPVLTKYSDKDSWLKMVKALLPTTLDQDLLVHVLRDDEEVFQSVLWTRVDYPDEVHDDLRESFMILEGECECYVEGEIIRIGAGGYFDVPMHAHHYVKILTKEVLAVVQRRRA